MYGLILENLSQYVCTKYGEDKWEEIRRMAHVERTTFSTHQVYPDNYIPRLTAKACKILGVSEREFLEGMGIFFVSFVGQYGYDRVLTVLGRHMRDFLNGLDNLHEYLKFSYPRMKAPSFFCENETPNGLTLHYRSTRRGYLWYTIGQIKEVGRHFYDTDVQVEVVKEESVFDTLHVMMHLSFDNRAFKMQKKLGNSSAMNKALWEKQQQVQKVDRIMLPVKSYIFLEIFPFCIVFDQDLVIRTIGTTLQTVMPSVVGRRIPEVFDLTRPMIDCTWRAILGHTNNIFEFTSVEPVKAAIACNREPLAYRETANSPTMMSMAEEEECGSGGGTYDYDDIKPEDKLLHLKGQMMYMEEWRCIVYLATPVMRDLDAMLHTGLFINDLSMHDFSRDMVLAGQQQSAELKLALDQELQKSRQLEESMRRLDAEMKRTDELLYQMIPKQVADRLRKGEAAVDTCQYFECVTILFSDVVSFTEICSRISPMAVVSMLNKMYSLFDQLTEKHRVYKVLIRQVETIGDAYMVVSGAPETNQRHAEKVCEMALDMVVVIGDLKDPSTGDSLKIRVGIHSGAVVAGVVGLKMPRYCLFGDTVNTASRMESTSEALKIHISEKTKELLNREEWEISERGVVPVKGKGLMKTYWLHGRKCLPLRPVADSESSFSEPEIKESTTPETVEARSVYSPVTFEEVTKLSPVHSVSSSYAEYDIAHTAVEVIESSTSGLPQPEDNTDPPMSLNNKWKGNNITINNNRISSASSTTSVPQPPITQAGPNVTSFSRLIKVRFAESPHRESLRKPAWEESEIISNKPVVAMTTQSIATITSSNTTTTTQSNVNGNTSGFVYHHCSCCCHCHHSPVLENITPHGANPIMSQDMSINLASCKESNLTKEVNTIQPVTRFKNIGCCGSSSPDKNDPKQNKDDATSSTCQVL